MSTRPAIVPPLALCLGGMDPSGGAGILRDALTLAELGVHPMLISTSETLQNGFGCHRIGPPAMDPIEHLVCLTPHLSGDWGVKLGLFPLGAAALKTLGRSLAALSPRVCIWDPILAPTRGVGLHSAGELRALAESLLVHPGWVVSPNRPEAEAFAGLGAEASPWDLAQPWLALGAKAVWLKGGHGEGEVEDFWVTGEGAQSLGRCFRLPGERRGTGCTLAAAWVAFSLRGQEPATAARSAASWLRGRWERAFAPGNVGRALFAPEAV